MKEQIEADPASFIIFATFNNGNVKLHKDFVLLPDRYIQLGKNEAVPIEDCGDWMLFDEEVTEDEAFNAYIKVLEEN